MPWYTLARPLCVRRCGSGGGGSGAHTGAGCAAGQRRAGQDCAPAHGRLLHQPGIYFPPSIDPPPYPQVAAYTSGRSRVSEYDCLLLRHILWQRPDEAERIYDWLLK